MSENGSGANKIIEQICIAEEIAKHVKLKPNKNELLGLCPFHNEDTPSFYVNPSKKLFYCFGCQAGGNVISFRAKITGMTASDALQSLAKDYNITLSGNFKDLTPYHTLLSFVKNYYINSLKSSSRAQKYLQNRGVTQSSIDNFEIGFAPEGWQNIHTIPQVDLKLAKALGLVIDNKKDGYDRFRNRIIFPIISHHGKLVGFGGRALGDDKPKYINSSDSEVYQKSHVLYGLNNALKHNAKTLIIVEGYMDVISLHESGFYGAVASLGTAFTTSHFKLAAKYAEEIIFCFDGDTAGLNAMHKAFLAILPLIRDQVSCAFLTMPVGEDPDSYLMKHGKERFGELLVSATPFSQYLLNHKFKDTGSLEQKAKYQHYSNSLLQQMPNSVLKQLIQKEIGSSQVEKHEISKPAAQATKTNINQQFIETAFSHRKVIMENKEKISVAMDVLPALVKEALNTIFSNQSSLAAFYNKHGLNYIKDVSALYKEDDVTYAEAEILNYITHCQIQATDTKIKALIQQVANGDTTESTSETLQKLLKLKHLLQKKKITLATCDNS